jgi:DsbC/DsbD-like thiol-disulfide interchange protein
MKRRSLLQLPLAFAMVAPLCAAPQPWSARLLKGGFDGKNYWAGLEITLAPGWKTYWRVPGDGGIAPQVDLTIENVASHEIHVPLPSRFEDEAGVTIGYKSQVVFPISIQPMNGKLPVKVSLKSFFGVCEVVCIPARFEGDVVFDPAVSAAPDQQLISQWQAKVPILSVEGPIVTATAEQGILVLDLLEPVTDIFIEGNPVHYFGKPDKTSGMVRIPVSGAKTADELKGNRLRITIDSNGRALEQNVTVR